MVTYDVVGDLARELLEDAWRRIAPKRLIASYDSTRG